MDAGMKNYLLDLIYLIQDKYNESFSSNAQDEGERQYINGLSFAYYEVLDLIESQLKAFGHDVEEMQPIVPQLGKRLVR